MTDETNAYAVKINGHTFVSLEAAKSLVDEARLDGWNLALEEAAKVADAAVSQQWQGRKIAAAIRALVKEPTVPGPASGFGS